VSRFCVLLLFTVVALVGTAARAEAPPDEAAIHGVIAAQIAAFRRDDAPAAFRLAAPGIQALFGTPQRFLAAVQTGYAPVYRPRSVQFGAIEDEDGRIVQRVELVGPDGLAYTARYSMEQEGDGAWRISGCELQVSRQTGV
jgi:hypothetical protein